VGGDAGAQAWHRLASGPASAFTEYRADRKNPIPLIYQSGYLTIKDYDREFRLYRLGFPNDEVRYGFLNFLLPFYTAVTDEERSFAVRDRRERTQYNLTKEALLLKMKEKLSEVHF
jgi:hypothetical protein